MAYLRVSTQEQGLSGLGLEAQRAAIAQWAAAHDARIVGEFIDIESGRRDDRPELSRALEHCKLTNASLIVARLDRLGRRLAFIARLMDSETEFVVANNPSVTRLTLHILAAVAEEEGRAIRERTKAALAAYKVRGGKLGSARPGHWEGREQVRLNGLKRGRPLAAVAVRQKADDFARRVGPRVTSMKQEGLNPRQIAERLNDQGIPTPRRGQWGYAGVVRLLERFQKIGG